ncbi:MAG: AbrB/MazE/SpoVT family DNA-binding domain-containing protein [Betaproteobacteria bacterium]
MRYMREELLTFCDDAYRPVRHRYGDHASALVSAAVAAWMLIAIVASQPTVKAFLATSPMPSATVTSKGQITIPKEVRDALGVDAGDRVEFVETAKGKFEVVAASRDVRELKGMIARPSRPVSVEDMRKAVARRAGR